ncbi:melanotransferrin-like isoform X2 [Varroa destructor]|uniref:Transferrin-like domain-containing protein n=1 Tax=Varroa destructor TaxID=109461 RepID=A0A7M7MHQ2_VARDE|nr:melanotransferrin-like isoform X2 [Varroa destructor]
MKSAAPRIARSMRLAYMFLFIVSVAHAALLGNITWCSVSDAEQLKCTEFAEAVRTSRQFSVDMYCVQAPSKDQCMNFLDNQKVDVVELDPGEMYQGGGHHSVIPILSELYGPEEEPGFYSVAAIHQFANISDLLHLRGRRACFSSVGDMAGWVVPMAHLIENRVLEVLDCNNLVKSASYFFGASCAPNSLLDKHNPTGDNPQKMCEICAGRGGDRCSGNDPYANYDGAFRCLEKDGEIAFLKHTTIHEATLDNPALKSRYRLLCPDGRVEMIDRHDNCNWGFVQPNVIATTSETSSDRRKIIQDFMIQALRLFGKPLPNAFNSQSGFNPGDFNGNPNRDSSFDSITSYTNTENQLNNNLYQSINSSEFRPPWESRLPKTQFNLFRKYGNGSNLLLQDRTTRFIRLDGQRQTYAGFLGAHIEVFQQLGKCPVPSAGFCVVSSQEYDKCQRMRSAFKAQNLKPDIHCVLAPTQLVCMHMIHQGNADLAMFEAGDIYRAGSRFGLVPILAEQYNLDEPYYYAVGVAQQKDKDTDLLYLKGKRVCSGGMFTAVGYVIPLAFLLTNDRMRSYGCDSARAMSEFFAKGCVPGALNKEFAAPHSNEYKSYRNLCDLCHGESRNYCSRDASEQFYGHSGAFRCLVEGGGEIAFVKHTTIFENTAGRNPLPWARNVAPEDFELLCRDGSRQTFDKYKDCNLGKVAANAMMTSKHKLTQEIEAYIALFVYAQQHYGSKYSEEFTFKMFVSEYNHRDLIFQDSTQQLLPIVEQKRNYRRYLGLDFLSAIRVVDCNVIINGAFPLYKGTSAYLITALLILVQLLLLTVGRIA